MAFADIAFGQIKTLRQTATPRNYEIWYTYATGFNPSLNQTINETLTQNATLADADLEQVYSTYISSVHHSDKIDNVGSQFVDEINQVMAMIDAAAGSANSHAEILASLTDKLSSTKDRESLRVVVETLVATANEMERSNNALKQQLNESKEETSQLQQNLEVVRTASLTDPLTSLANRKQFDDGLASALAESLERSEPLSLLMADIDYFKSFNDNWGHVTGDEVLRMVAFSLKQNVKEQDIAARYGGEEFAVILPNTALRSASALADQVRRVVMSKKLKQSSTGQNLGQVTISIGCAIAHWNDTVHSLIARADACLYAAKRNGRNRIICETDPELAQVKAAVA
jgi:diguanylate cyclase